MLDFSGRPVAALIAPPPGLITISSALQYMCPIVLEEASPPAGAIKPFAAALCGKAQHLFSPLAVAPWLATPQEAGRLQLNGDKTHLEGHLLLDLMLPLISPSGFLPSRPHPSMSITHSPTCCEDLLRPSARFSLHRRGFTTEDCGFPQLLLVCHTSAVASSALAHAFKQWQSPAVSLPL